MGFQKWLLCAPIRIQIEKNYWDLEIVFVTQKVWKLKDRKDSNHSLFPFTQWYLHKYPFFDAVCIFCIWHIYAMVGLLHLIMQGKQINMRVSLFPIP